MKPLSAIRILLVSGLLAFLPGALHAQTATKIFVASFGNDANDGSRGSPKRNFQPAHDAVANNGQIVVLDTAGYGQLNITKGLSITVPPGVNGFITVGDNTYGVAINANFSENVALRGLVVEGINPNAGGLGIIVNSAQSVTIEDCTVRNFNEGIVHRCFAFNERFYVFNCEVRNCVFGLGFVPGQAGAITAAVRGCRLQENTTGMRFVGSDSSNVVASVSDSILAGNGTGVLASLSGSGGEIGKINVSISESVIAGNSAAGINGQGAATIVRINNSNITANGTGVSASSSGQILSRGNNTLENNTNGNTFPGAYSPK